MQASFWAANRKKSRPAAHIQRPKLGRSVSAVRGRAAELRAYRPPNSAVRRSRVREHGARVWRTLQSRHFRTCPKARLNVAGPGALRWVHLGHQIQSAVPHNIVRDVANAAVLGADHVFRSTSIRDITERGPHAGVATRRAQRRQNKQRADGMRWLLSKRGLHTHQSNTGPNRVEPPIRGKVEAAKHGDEPAASKSPQTRTPFIGVHAKETAGQPTFFHALLHWRIPPNAACARLGGEQCSATLRSEGAHAA